MNSKDYKLESAQTRELLSRLFRGSQSFSCTTKEARWIKEVILDSTIWLEGFVNLVSSERELVEDLVKQFRKKYKDHDNCRQAMRYYIAQLDLIIQMNDEALKAKT